MMLRCLLTPDTLFSSGSSQSELSKQLSLAQRLAQVGFWEMPVPDCSLLWSEGTGAIFGIEQGGVSASLKSFFSFVHPADRERVRAAFGHAMEQKDSLDLGYRIVRADGRERHVFCRAVFMPGKEGDDRFFGTLQDITEPIAREEKADQNTLLLQLAGRMANIGGWKFDLASNRFTWTDEVCTIHEVAPGTSPSLEEAFAFLAPACRDKIRDLLDRCRDEGETYDEEIQLTTATGRTVWVRAIAEPVFGADGTVSYPQGAVQDITRFREAEENARRLAEHLNTTLESITDAVYTLDHEWRFTYMNRQAERLFRKPRGELTGKVLWDEFSGLYDEVVYREFHRAAQEHQTVAFEQFYEPYGSLFEIRAFPSETGLTVYFRDITRVRQTEESLRLSEERFRIIAKTTTDAIWDWNLKTDTVWYNENIEILFGYTPDEFAATINLWADRIHPDDRSRVLNQFYAAVNGRAESWIDEYRFVRKDESVCYVLDRASIIRNAEGRATRMVGSMVDLTEHRDKDARMREQASLLDKAKDAIVVRGIDNRVRYWNKGAERLYGWTSEEVIGRSVEDMLYENPADFHEATRHVLETGEWSGEIIERRKDGSALPVDVQWTLMRDDAGQPQSIFAIKTDISLRKAAEHKIQRLAFYDPLTQLPNRQLFMDRLHHAIESSAHNGRVNALVFIDLDNFKALNDTLGHTTGDRLLQQVAERLTGCLKSSDTVARFGGDEYVVLLENLGQDEELAHRFASQIANRILTLLTQPYELENGRHHSSSSMGLTLFRKHTDDVVDLLKQADLAMYEAKAAGRNTLRFFNPDMQSAVSARVRLEASLRQGLRDRELTLYYQPQVDQHGHTTGVEALVRWRPSGRGTIDPAEFIPLAEETGLILPLGEWVMETACAQLAAWKNQPGTSQLVIAVNVSARQFHHPSFVEQMLAVLGRTGADPQRLKLELTESLLLDDLEDTIAKMNVLKARGISFALDDFGTGYSSLAYLQRLPLDTLKIDGSFVRELRTNPNDAAIARTIIVLGQNLGLTVIAEGVETEDQFSFLSEHGCDAFQGFLFGKPVLVGELEQMLAQNLVATRH
ncbi:MAG: hypothetical protein JWP36_78 [Paucimonas sp.]|nr:hypothetical protein [Paucimonas sp.]